jgi:hypothetical protein
MDLFVFCTTWLLCLCIIFFIQFFLVFFAFCCIRSGTRLLNPSIYPRLKLTSIFFQPFFKFFYSLPFYLEWSQQLLLISYLVFSLFAIPRFLFILSFWYLFFRSLRPQNFLLGLLILLLSVSVSNFVRFSHFLVFYFLFLVFVCFFCSLHPLNFLLGLRPLSNFANFLSIHLCREFCQILLSLVFFSLSTFSRFDIYLFVLFTLAIFYSAFLFSMIFLCISS